MSKNKLSIFCFIIGITSISISYLSAADCVDDPNGTVAAGSAGSCAQLVEWVSCTGTMGAGNDADVDCPVTCNTCPGVCGDGECSSDETSAVCPADCPVCADAPVCLNILNVDADAGTLDVHMVNQPGCTYYEGTTKIFDPTMTEAECDALANDAGVWFNGSIMGFQLVISSVGLTTTNSATTSVTGGSALDLVYTINLNPSWERDVDGNGTIDISGTMIIAFNLDLTPIPPGEGALITLAYTGYAGNSICFSEQDCSTGACVNVVNDTSGAPLDVDWGDCYCPGDIVADCAGVCGGTATVDCNNVCGGPLLEDCLGICGGTATADCSGECGGDCTACDCAGVCGGTAEVDECGECGGDGVCDDMAISQIGSNLPVEFSISQNYPNPFNPVTAITFDVTKMDKISLIVYDLSGKEVITLASGTFMPGSYLVNWDAVNSYGDAISSGMYVYRYISGDKAITRKMLYLK